MHLFRPLMPVCINVELNKLIVIVIVIVVVIVTDIFDSNSVIKTMKYHIYKDILE